MTEIKPCPFCGEKPELNFQVYDTSTYKTYNLSCCVTMEGELDAEELIQQWNDRQTKPTVAYYSKALGGFFITPKFMNKENIPAAHLSLGVVRLVEE